MNEIKAYSMEDSIEALVDFAVELFLQEKDKVREIFNKAPELGKMQSVLKIRQTVVDRLALEMKNHHFRMKKTTEVSLTNEDYVRLSFVAVNSVMGVIHTMIYDSNQNYSNEEISVELKKMLNTYFQSKIKSL